MEKIHFYSEIESAAVFRFEDCGRIRAFALFLLEEFAMIDLQDIQIPPLSTVTVRVMQFDPLGENASSQGLEQIVAPDEGVCSDLLRIANSAYYGRSGRVKTLRDAITLLGLKTVKNLVILLASKSMNHSLKV